MSILNASNENSPWTICFADDKVTKNQKSGQKITKIIDLTRNLFLQTKRRSHSVKNVNLLGFYYKLRLFSIALNPAQPLPSLQGEGLGVGSVTKQYSADFYVITRKAPMHYPTAKANATEQKSIARLFATT